VTSGNANPASSDPPKGDTPIWSVMIPVYNGVRQLAQALDSVVAQGFDEREMQIEVVDDCSTHDDPESVVKAIYGGRVSF
jgi:glycosyltransferase involved in cell wall biosynthesis